MLVDKFASSQLIGMKTAWRVDRGVDGWGEEDA